jgi:hypothetical protein
VVPSEWGIRFLLKFFISLRRKPEIAKSRPGPEPFPNSTRCSVYAAGPGFVRVLSSKHLTT